MTKDDFLRKYRYELAGRVVYGLITQVKEPNIVQWAQDNVVSSEFLLERMYADLVPSPPTTTKGSSK